MNTTMRTALEVAHYAMLKFAPEECEREIKTAKAALDENPVPAKWIERNAAVYQKGVNDGLALADKGRQKSEAMTGPFTAEVNSWRRWEIYSRSQHLCHCDTEEKRYILIKALNFWQSGADLAEDNARLERIVKDLNDANRVLFESQREAAESADEKPDGQAENANVDAAADDKTQPKKSDV